MRNRVTVAEAAFIGARLRKARLRAQTSVKELGALTGVHHSQVSRCELGDFKIVSPNVQKLCEYFKIEHPRLPRFAVRTEGLRARFDVLLTQIPASASAFERLFDVLEESQARKPKTRKA
ncbi:helix-turn-helix domain-containing protein [Variovorax paradoxus]|uniref:helix-turn-helix domain-containing protein n=1 Tax=Variovorax paradoxus TaxID=34073 RepID=UPI0035C8FA0A